MDQNTQRNTQFWLLLDCPVNCLWTVTHRFVFFTLSNKVKKYLYIRFVCLSVRPSLYPSVHTLSLVNILQKSWNLNMLFISDIAWTVLKMVCMRQTVYLQRHTKIFRYIKAYEGKYLKHKLICLCWNKCNIIDICHSDTQKHVSYEKWYKCYKYFVYRITQKCSDPMEENV